MGPAQNQDERTWWVTLDIETFEGIGTLSHQLYYPSKIFLVSPRERELSEVKTVRQVQQLVCNFSHPFDYVKVKGPGKHG